MQVTYDTRGVAGYLEPLAVDPDHTLSFAAHEVKNFGKLWKPKTDSILSWSILPRDRTTFYLLQQSGNNPAFLPLCNDAFISSVNYEEFYLLITLQAEDVPGFVFTIVFPANEVRYSHDSIREYLAGKAQPVLVDHIVSQLLNLSTPKRFVQSWQQYTSNIWSALSDHAASKAKGPAPARRTSVLALGAGSGSGTAQSGLASPEATPATQSRKRANPNPSSSGARKRSKKSKSKLGGSSVTFMNPTIKHATCEKDIDYDSAEKALKNFWEKCEPCYVFGRDTPPVEVSIDLLEKADARFVVRELETTGIAHYKNIMANQMDVNSSHTIIIMPIIDQAPETWDWATLVAMKCKFRIIDGQHHISAARQLIADGKVDDKKIKALKKWRAQVVWHSDANMIMDVSIMANKTNNAGTFTPSWATNIMGARSVWKDYGSPAKLGPRPKNGRETDEIAVARKRYEVRLVDGLISI